MTGMTSPFQASVEMIVGTLHVSTHIDALIHIQSEGRIYGGELARNVRDDKGWKKHGMETVPPILSRGVFLNVARTLGNERLPDRYEIAIDDVQRTLAASNLMITQGDIVMIRTGKIQQYGDPDAFLAEEPGVGREAAIWMYDQGKAVLGTDTTGTEPVPLKDAAKTTHHAMLVDRGVHLIGESLPGRARRKFRDVRLFRRASAEDHGRHRLLDAAGVDRVTAAPADPDIKKMGAGRSGRAVFLVFRIVSSRAPKASYSAHDSCCLVRRYPCRRLRHECCPAQQDRASAGNCSAAAYAARG